MLDFGSVQKVKDINVIIVPKYILPFGYGLTLWKLVLVRKDAKSVSYQIAHEACHVKQWTSTGFFKFTYLYLKELYKNGYENNKYEVEARKYGRIMKTQYKMED